ncbi:MAG: Ppx/GppA family phosphatase [Alphaproteobacteria bacterium]|nr:Ppx/GppA family phosphatase [Alphaproteobacteria bacterium]
MAAKPAKSGGKRRGRSAAQGRIAVIDIGSNSVRLVMFDGLARAPIPIFNEKVLCALGRDIARTDKLNPEGVVMALDAIARFAQLARACRVDRVDAVATAAMRDASDGEAFVAKVKKRAGIEVRVVSGKEEGRLSAQGVLSAFPGANGLMGDLGGGSLEVVALDRGKIGHQTTLPVGPLMLKGDNKAERREEIDEALATAPWLRGVLQGRDLYLVGGAWRTIARIHMAQARYPLRVIHGYTLPADTVVDLAGLVAQLSRTTLLGIEGVSARRIDTLPAAALVLRRLIKTGKPRTVVFSAHGLREGMVFDRLPPARRTIDPLLAAAEQLAVAEGRADGFGAAVDDWLAPVFAGIAPDRRRLHRTACLLSDIGWREHPDYRAEHACYHGLRAPFIGIDHAGRGFVALALFARYAGLIESDATLVARRLLGPDEETHALAVGLGLRLAHTLSGGTTELLRRTWIHRESGTLVLTLGVSVASLKAEIVERRLTALARALDLKSRIETL